MWLISDSYVTHKWLTSHNDEQDSLKLIGQEEGVRQQGFQTNDRGQFLKLNIQ